MALILGIESTAHTFGIGIVMDGKVLANKRKMYTTKSGGIIPVESAKHHCECKNEIYFEALAEAGLGGRGGEIDAVAFSQGPGLAPCLLEGMKFAKELSERLDKPLVGVNHCVAHLEIGKLVGAKDPVMLYASGANTQVIAYETGKYRVFGETLDLGVGNFIDTIARYAGMGFPGGPVIEKLAKEGNYVELPYSVKGMDVALSGIQTKLKQMIDKLDKKNKMGSKGMEPNKLKPDYDKCKGKKYLNISGSIPDSSSHSEIHPPHPHASASRRQKNTLQGHLVDYTLSDLAFSLQETVFAMLVEIAERALAHTGKRELLLGGGVACNTRLQEMCKEMCDERVEEVRGKVKFFCPERQFLVDNAGMIAFLGEIMFKAKANVFKPTELEKVDIHPRERTDDVGVSWR